jgi:regulator of CtrA degradation
MSRFTASEQFDKVFREGMGLVEETANYLDGPGRQDARLLDRHGAVAYATESMRLTTRLMQLASWLLLQRAIGAGEMNQDDVRKERHRISLSDIGRGKPLNGAEQLPPALNDIVERSL